MGEGGSDQISPLVQATISGLWAGAVYALLAMGLVVSYRASRVLNLAHGESFAVAAVAAVLLTRIGIPIWLTAPIAIAIAMGFAAGLVQFLLLRPRTHWPHDALILITLGVAFVSRGVLFLVLGPDPQSFPALVTGPPIALPGAMLARQAALLLAVSLALCAIVTFFLTRTRVGKELRASAENPEAAQLLGIDVERARLLAYGLAGFLGGTAAILLVPLISVDFQVGLELTLRGFIAAAMAGMLSPTTAIVSGMTLGLVEAFIASHISTLYRNPIVFIVLIGIAVWLSRKTRFGGASRA